MNIGTPKRLKDLEAMNSSPPSTLGQVQDAPLLAAGFKECWEAVKPVLEAAEDVLEFHVGIQRLRDAWEGLALEE